MTPHPGLRRWFAVNRKTSEHSRRKEAWASTHHDGSVTLTTAFGGQSFSSDALLKLHNYTSLFLPGHMSETSAHQPLLG